MDLVQLVFTWKQRLFSDEFEEYTSEPPDVHLLVVVAISHQALRSPVPPRGDVVSVGSWGVLALAGT